MCVVKKVALVLFAFSLVVGLYVSGCLAVYKHAGIEATVFFALLLTARLLKGKK